MVDYFTALLNATCTIQRKGRAITGATNATPIVVTLAGHGYSNGNTTTVAGVLGNTAANGSWTLANITSDTFELVNSVGNGAYTEGGFVLPGKDAGGQPVFTWQDSATGVLCRLESRAVRGDFLEMVQDRKVVIENINMMFPPATDITEKDRITTVVVNDVALTGDIFSVLLVHGAYLGTEKHHIEAALDRNKGGAW